MVKKIVLLRLQNFKHVICSLVTLVIFCMPEALGVSNLLLSKIQSKYGLEAVTRVEQWQKLMQIGMNQTEQEKLLLVNDFFNQQLDFVDDIDLWRQKDYWATPLEFLTKGAGDCEDFSIAKYFSLIEMGVPEKKMRITYVKALRLDRTHMVLSYFSSPNVVPVVLDNIIPQIKSATNRDDLLSIYRFNGSGLWLVNSSGNDERVGVSSDLNRWAELRKRMQKNLNL